MNRKNLRILILLLGLIFTGVEAHCQIAADTVVQRVDTTRKLVSSKDIIDVLKNLRKKNRRDSVKVDTIIKTGKVLFSIVPAFGYTLTSGLIGSMNVNSAFYSSNPQETRISSITANFIYTQYKQITVPLQASIWTRNNDLNILTDWRYFKYPQDTYGLGPNTEISDASKIDYSHIRLHQTVLKKITSSFYAGAGFFYDYRWKIIQEDRNDDVQKYGLTSKSRSSGPVGTLVYDSRTNSINPEKGFYASFQYRASLNMFKSTSNWNSTIVDVRKYFNLPQGSRNTLAFWSYNWLTLTGKPPYLDLPSTGWDPATSMGRGYIQGRFRSPKLLYFESEYRMSLTRNGLFGAVVFANAQSVSDWPSNRFNKVAPAGGVGLRIKVNKKSRANVAIDYGFGMKGSRGLFVNLGEVF